MNNFFLLLDNRAAIAERGDQAIGHWVAFDTVLLTNFAALEECDAAHSSAGCLWIEGRNFWNWDVPVGIE